MLNARLRLVRVGAARNSARPDCRLVVVFGPEVDAASLAFSCRLHFSIVQLCHMASSKINIDRGRTHEPSTFCWQPLAIRVTEVANAGAALYLPVYDLL